MSGKGSTKRPLAVDESTFTSNWEAIFGSRHAHCFEPDGDYDKCACGEQRKASAGWKELSEASPKAPQNRS